jgi:transposase
MRKVREVLRLRHALSLSYREISEALGVGKTAAGEIVRRAEVVGLTWPLPEVFDDGELERRLFTAPGEAQPERPAPAWAKLHEELKRRSVTLVLLWQEYRAEHPDGYGYSRFCDLYSAWRCSVSATMRQTHVAGDKLFVGEGLPDWISAHVNTLAAIGGVPRAVICDNLKAGVTKPSRYEPGINRTYQELATHYGFAVLPARIKKPRDKAKAEVAVQIVQRFVLARLRNRRFFSLDELNVAIRECVTDLNDRIMRKLGKSRRELLETIERPALKPLPAEPYRYAEWKRARVAPDYHIEIAGHYYSVPSRLIREVVEARITSTTVEIFHRRTRVASHAFSLVRNQHTTIAEHMPSAHRRYAEWTPARLMREAEKIGSATLALFEAIMRAKPHPEQGFRSCLGILRLAKEYGVDRLEAACRRGNDIGARSYGSIASILRHGLDRAYAQEKVPDGAPIQHANIRGQGYYH